MRDDLGLRIDKLRQGVGQQDGLVKVVGLTSSACSIVDGTNAGRSQQTEATRSGREGGQGQEGAGGKKGQVEI